MYMCDLLFLCSGTQTSTRGLKDSMPGVCLLFQSLLFVSGGVYHWYSYVCLFPFCTVQEHDLWQSIVIQGVVEASGCLVAKPLIVLF